MKQSIISNCLRGSVFFLFFVLCITAFAGTDYYCDFSVNGIYYQYISGTTDEVAVSYDNYETGRYGGNYTNYSGYVSVPATVTYNGKTYKVTAVSDHAFQECSVTTVNLPSTIKSIGYAAFIDCYQLTSVNLPSSITIIRDNAFNGCTVLGNVTLPAALKSIGASAFQNCKTFTNIDIPDGVTTIGASAFQSCSNLTSISIPSSVVSVGSSAFSGTAWYTNQPNGMVYFGCIAYCYKGTMPENTTIDIKEGTTSIAGGAFTNCVNLVSVSIPSSVTSIGNNAFYFCSGIKSVDIPNTVKKIENYTFYGCTSLSSVNIPNGVISIGDYAFQGCSSLKSLNVPNSITSIGYYAFSGCSGLTSVTIGSGVSEFGDYAFYGCTNLSSLEIKDGVTSIGNCTFQSCSSLSTINLPNSLISIGSNAFSGCAWITNLPDGVVYAGKVAYCYKGTMDDYTNITLKEGTLGIASYAFSSCSLLSSVTLPSSLKKIGPNAFHNCSNLTSVTALMKVPMSIDNSIFNYRNFATLHVPAGYKDVYEAADYWKEFKEIVEMPSPYSSRLTVTSSTICKGGKIKFPVSMENEEEITAFQFDVEIPQGVTMTDVQLGERSSDSHTVDFNKQADGSYRVIVVSLQKAPFSGNEGELVSLMLSADNDIEGGDYNIGVNNIVLTTTSKEKIYPDDVNSVLTVLNIRPGDADGDGSVDVADVVTMIDYILDSSTSDIIFSAADMNTDGEIDIFDVMIAINIILNRDNSARSRTRASDNMKEQAIVMATADGGLLGINDAGRFTAFQFDVEVAGGMELTEAHLNSNERNHKLYLLKNGKNTYRVIGVSMDNSTLTGCENDLVRLSFSKGGHVQISNIVFVTPQKSKIYFASGYGEVTGIGNIRHEQSEEIFDLSGRKVNSDRNRLPKGVYIINNKKVVIE